MDSIGLIPPSKIALLGFRLTGALTQGLRPRLWLRAADTAALRDPRFPRDENDSNPDENLSPPR